MRIGIDGRYVQDYFPGIGRYTHSLVRALGAVDRDNEYVVYHDPRQVNTRYDLRELGGARVLLRPVRAAAFSLAEQVALPLAVRRDRVDVFHSPYYVKPFWLPCPSVVSIHDAIGARYPHYLSSLKARLSFRPAMWLAIATAALVVVPSQATLEDLVQFFGVATEKVVVIYMGADELFPPAPPAAARPGRLSAIPDGSAAGGESLALPERAPYLLFVGANKPHKNLVRLARAYQQAAVEQHLVVVGREDPRFPEARREVQALGLEERVHFLGEVDEDLLRRLYRSATAVVLPSLVEGFGLPALEALACGTPVACSQAGSLLEVVGDAAVTFDPQDVDQMAAALRTVVSNGRLRADLIARGRARAQRFSWKRAALETISVYQRVCRGRVR